MKRIDKIIERINQGAERFAEYEKEDNVNSLLYLAKFSRCRKESFIHAVDIILEVLEEN